MSTLSFNCRGVGDPATVHEVRDLVRTHLPSILCLLETQIAKYRVEGLARTLGLTMLMVWEAVVEVGVCASIGRTR
jgi:hypothetical protein